jgi:GrpB-like predicted nucleotidyltransferase (UPF0157 family)
MIELVEYRSSWPTEFMSVGQRLRSALGPLAIRIDHVGSTSVPGLCAKDVLDLQVSVLELHESVKNRVLAVGFRQPPGEWKDHRPPAFQDSDDDWTKFFFYEPSGSRRINLHVRAVGRANQRYALLFRDFLKAHPPYAAAYGEFKRRLAVSLRSPDDYPDVKDPAVDLIYFAAESWASRNSWQPGPSGA